jgi:hypothetical protein
MPSQFLKIQTNLEPTPEELLLNTSQQVLTRRTLHYLFKAMFQLTLN